MSSMVSRSPSLRNQSNDAFWMSIRCGSSRTCFTREKEVRARGAATLVVKRYSLPQNGETDEKSRTGENGGTSARLARVAKTHAATQGTLPAGSAFGPNRSARSPKWEGRGVLRDTSHKARLRGADERGRPPGGGLPFPAVRSATSARPSR